MHLKRSESALSLIAARLTDEPTLFWFSVANNEIAWRPGADTIARAQLTRFLTHTRKDTFDDLHRWSVEDIGAFTESVLTFLKIPFQRSYEKILDLSEGPEWARWCIGGHLNISIACLDIHPPDRIAVLWEGEEGTTRSLTYGELTEQVNRFAAGLRNLGVAKGDAIALHLPMLPETVVALLACARLGAVAVPLFSGYGPSAIESRIRDVEARILITADGFVRRGATVLSRTVAEQAASRCPSVRHVIVVPRLGLRGNATEWHDLMLAKDLQPECTSAEDPLMVLYTSGTTGKPKGILHSHCGFPIKAAQDMCLGTDVGAGTHISWITDIGWMMGPWLIYGSLILGATICLYDGAPDYPGPGRLWEFCRNHAVEVLGISPTLVRSLAAQGAGSIPAVPPASLRVFASTGEAWNEDPWWWLFRNIGREHIPIINYSGGTEISGGILMGNLLSPLKPAAFAAPCPGIAADVLDENGNPVVNSVGELVIRKPWIGMARGFYRDPERYMDTYWSRWPGIWTHGDWALRDETGSWYILGRSDDTLKVAGKRIGPAEVESILVSDQAVAEAAVIAVPHEIKGECMIAFCVATPGHTPTEELAGQLRDRVGEHLGKPLRPETVCFIAAIPKTRNAKVMRRVIRSAWMGEDPGDISALENPDSVELIRSAQRNATSVPVHPAPPGHPERR